MRKRSINLYIVLIILVIGLALGYAYLTAMLNINGTTQIDRTVWNVHFENVQMMPGSVSETQPTLNSETTSLSFSTRLQKPGDYYAFYVDVKNDGTIDAMISEVVSKINNVVVTTLPSYLEYDVTYADEYPIESNHILTVNEKETLLVRVAYKHNLSALDLPSTAQSLNMSLSTNYVQATDAAINRDRYLYTLYGEYSQIGATIISEEELPRYLNSYDSTLSNKGIFIRMLVNSEDIIQRAFIGYKLNDQLYYFEGGYGQNEDILQEHIRLIYELNWCNTCTGCLNCDSIACPIGNAEMGRVAMFTSDSACYITTSKWIVCFEV